MRIGIDIDGVLTDFEKWQLDYGSKYFLKYNKNIVNPDGYDSDTVFNVTNEMVNMMSTMRNFQSSQSIFKMIDGTLDLAANSIGKV